MGLSMTWKWSDRAKEYLQIFHKEGAESAAIFASKFKRLDKLRTAITKEINASTNQGSSRSGQSDGKPVPSGEGAESSMEVAGPTSEHSS